MDLHGMPLNHDIDFAIDFEWGNKPIYILSYIMALAELKKINGSITGFF